MFFITHAQNFEDVMLWRALKHVTPGFYIDIGAAWPDQDSVTKSFYDNGWHGINVEPNPKFLTLLNQSRTRDQNLGLAVGEKEGQLEINYFEDTGLSTLDSEIAKNHIQDGYVQNKQKVHVKTLDAIWNLYVPKSQDVHFLKVDVEGCEASVLRSNNWKKNRPWVVVVEATLPMTQTESHNLWEDVIVNENYEFVYADGLNRFYVAKEHLHLNTSFKYPPNVFDTFINRREVHLEMAFKDLNQQYKDLNQQYKDLELSLVQANLLIEKKGSELSQVYNSSSWRLTAPLRLMIQLPSHIAMSIRQSNRLKNTGKSIVRLFPSLESRLIRIINNSVQDPLNNRFTENVNALSQPALENYLALVSAREKIIKNKEIS